VRWRLERKIGGGSHVTLLETFGAAARIEGDDLPLIEGPPKYAIFPVTRTAVRTSAGGASERLAPRRERWNA